MCGRDSCGGGACGTAAAARKRAALPTGGPKLDDPDAFEKISEIANLTMRDVPPPGTKPDLNDLYTAIKKIAQELNIYDEAHGETALKQEWFLGEDKNILVQDFYGCLGVIVVSHTGTYTFTISDGSSATASNFVRQCRVFTTDVLTGVFVSHTWEASMLRDDIPQSTFQSEVLDLFEYVTHYSAYLNLIT
jgi:hypothetical protein